MPAAAAEKPLWELGAGLAALQLPDYRGSDKNRFYLLPYPYFIYRGDIVQVDRERISGKIFKNMSERAAQLIKEEMEYMGPVRLSDVEAAFAEPLAAALEINERTHVRPTDTVAVIGDGKLGLLVAQVLQLTGCDLMVVGHHSRHLNILERRGIATVTSGEGLKRYDIVVDCTGNPSGWKFARKLVRPRGTIVLKSTFHGSQETCLTPVVVDEVTITGSRCGPFPPALRLLEQKLVDVKSLVEAEYPIDKAVEAFQHARRPGALKIQIVM